jgi:hypothetical protein
VRIAARKRGLHAAFHRFLLRVAGIAQMAMQVDERGHEYEPANVHRSIRAPPVQRAAEDDFACFDHEVAIAIPVASIRRAFRYCVIMLRSSQFKNY